MTKFLRSEFHIAARRVVVDRPFSDDCGVYVQPEGPVRYEGHSLPGNHHFTATTRAMQRVQSKPQPGQYVTDGILYEFNAADVGKEVRISGLSNVTATEWSEAQ